MFTHYCCSLVDGVGMCDLCGLHSLTAACRFEIRCHKMASFVVSENLLCLLYTLFATFFILNIIVGA